MSNRKLAFEFLTTQEWALDGKFLERMASVALREDLDLIGALEAKSGRRISQITEMRDGVAVIHVNGVVSRYANLFHAVCGGVSTEVLAKEFTAAVNEPSVKAVILNIDSPGGEASGIHELGEMIYKARSKKPIHAYVGGMGCSAAYWIATSCDRVTIDATARVGSIGTVVSFVKRQDNEGTKSYEFVSSQSPNKRLDPESEQGQSAIQSQLDEMAEVFIKCVARNMNVSADKVKSDFGKGGVMLGQRAVDAGMAHELGSLEDLISSLSKGRSGQPTKTQATANPIGQPTTNWLALDDTQPESIVKALREQYPEAVAMFEQQTETLSASAALDLAESVDLPMMARKLSSMTEEAANRYIQQASSMRDTLAAAGLSGSFSTLAKHIDDPARLVGMAIHETKAYADENSDSSRFVCDDTPTVQGGYDPTEIYKRRNQR
ncbi:TPA: S49 family peptidase [Vibrio parahaemolyticus]|nr:S49 family peptidase [Vibrio parahaemolyticus]HCH4062838.1 S49 family peptidase [Vibrio parahaemolyticus]